MEIELITISLQRPAKISKHSAMQVSFAQIPSQMQTFHCDQYITDCLRVLKIGLFHVIQIPYISKSACYHPRHQEIYGDCNLVSVAFKLILLFFNTQNLDTGSNMQLFSVSLLLGIDTPTYQISVTPKQSSCLTSLKCK